eukprot:1193059-Prorocentrum_minimum.AAC.1
MVHLGGLLLTLDSPLDVSGGGARDERVRGVRGEEGVDHAVRVALGRGEQRARGGVRAQVRHEQPPVRVAPHQQRLHARAHPPRGQAHHRRRRLQRAMRRFPEARLRVSQAGSGTQDLLQIAHKGAHKGVHKGARKGARNTPACENKAPHLRVDDVHALLPGGVPHAQQRNRRLVPNRV